MSFTKGETVRVTAGRFAGKHGMVQKIIERDGKVVYYLIAFMFEESRHINADSVGKAFTPVVKAGDRVRINTKGGRWEAQEGTVVDTVRDAYCSAVVVEFDSEERSSFFEDVVEIIDPAPVKVKEPKIGQEIEFDQIRAGDRILTVREFEDGFTLTMEGVATRKRGDGAWMSPGERGHCVAPREKGALAIKQHHILKGREEPKNWFVYSQHVLSGGVNIHTLSGRTEKDAKELADEWNGKEKTVGDRRIFWAAKAEK
ncbi:Hypothetical Protein OBI_RACECAR_269 [Arthrobacter phage Racecar]|nr:hypothetical protein PBI_RACECAR_61 [Arthrobacter phage Racecar]QFG12745.1 hypothetical protein PBI_MIMI_61 [Arthrobacter phage Mimi]